MCLVHGHEIEGGKKEIHFASGFTVYRMKNTLNSAFIHRGEQRGDKSPGLSTM